MTYRIFLVEDDRSIAEGLQHQLEQWNFEVRVVQNFRGVLGEFTAFDPHLVLMDIMLPCYDGYHWCREIRRVSEVPIIFLSSASDNMNLIMAMNMGGDDFIPKPFDWNVLLAKIQALLRRIHSYGPKIVVGTRGAEGQIVFDGEQFYVGKAAPATVVDTMGAGDSFTCSFSVAYTDSKKTGSERIREAMDFAAKFAAKICGINGSVGDGLPDLRGQLGRFIQR